MLAEVALGLLQFSLITSLPDPSTTRFAEEYGVAMVKAPIDEFCVQHLAHLIARLRATGVAVSDSLQSVRPRARSTLRALSVALLLTWGLSAGWVQAQSAPGAPVTIPSAETGFGSSGEVLGTFGQPAKAKDKLPAVLILHGSAGIDGRGAFYATALQEAGIATLEIEMFARRGRPAQEDIQATLPHAAAALRWLKAQPVVDAQRIGVMGFSWGGRMSVVMSSELVQEKLGAETPRPRALAPMYPSCSSPRPTPAGHSLHRVNDRMSATPMLIQVGTEDDAEVRQRPCDYLRTLWPKQAADLLVIRYIDGATHGFDGRSSRGYYSASRGGYVRVAWNSKQATEARETVVRFFVEHLNP